MFSIMGNCMSWCKEKRAPGRKVTLSILGLDNAGKTVTAKSLQKESIENVAPTVGFTSVTFNHKKNEVVMFDLGGGKRIRDIWKNYYAESYGIIYVVDSTDRARLPESRVVLQRLVEHPLVAGKPMLVLCNKQDEEGALDEIEITEALELELLVNMNKTPCKVELCSAVFRKGKKIDATIEKGLDWMMDQILSNWEKASLRVEQDINEQKGRDEQENVDRKDRVRRIREERERKEKLERRKKGLPEDSDEDRDMGDPFKRVDPNQYGKSSPKLTKRVAAQQNATRRSNRYDDDDDVDISRRNGNAHRSYDDAMLGRHGKAPRAYGRQLAVDSEEDSQDSETGVSKKSKGYPYDGDQKHTPRSSRSDGYMDDVGYGSSGTRRSNSRRAGGMEDSPHQNRRYNSRSPSPTQKRDSDNEDYDSDDRYSRSKQRSSQYDRHKRPESPDRYGRNRQRVTRNRYDHSDDDDDDDDGDRNTREKVDTYRSWNPEKRTPRPKDASPSTYGRMTRSYTDDDVIGRGRTTFDLKPLSHRALSPLPPLAPLEPLDNYAKKKKVPTATLR